MMRKTTLLTLINKHFVHIWISNKKGYFIKVKLEFVWTPPFSFMIQSMIFSSDARLKFTILHHSLSGSSDLAIVVFSYKTGRAPLRYAIVLLNIKPAPQYRSLAEGLSLRYFCSNHTFCRLNGGVHLENIPQGLADNKTRISCATN